MKTKYFRMIIILILGSMPVYSQQTEDVESFLKAPTQEARSMISGFSDQFLEAYADQYRSTLKPEEARKLWLIEEAYKRKADKIAADRLFYVFLAVSLLMVLIFALTFRIYQMQKKIMDME